MEDPGLTDNFVTHELAEELGLPSKAMSLSIWVLDNQYIYNRTKLYSRSLTDMRGVKP